MITSFTGWISVAERDSFFFFMNTWVLFPLRGSTNLCIHSFLSRLQRQYVPQFFLYISLSCWILSLFASRDRATYANRSRPYLQHASEVLPFSFVSVQSVCEPFSAFLLMSFFKNTFSGFVWVISGRARGYCVCFDDLPAEMKCLLFDFLAQNAVLTFSDTNKSTWQTQKVAIILLDFWLWKAGL